ncbi:hypothetical protein B0H34DRAFT_856070, partial [Crassisporium funariophilum]
MLEQQARINSPPMAGKPKQNMVTHLTKCTKVSAAVRVRAVEWKHTKVTNTVITAAATSTATPGPSTTLILHPRPILHSHSWSSGYNTSQPLLYITALALSAQSNSTTPSPIGSPLLLSGIQYPNYAFKRRRTSDCVVLEGLPRHVEWNTSI